MTPTSPPAHTGKVTSPSDGSAQIRVSPAARLTSAPTLGGDGYVAGRGNQSSAPASTRQLGSSNAPRTATDSAAPGRRPTPRPNAARAAHALAPPSAARVLEVRGERVGASPRRSPSGSAARATLSAT